MNYLSHAYKHLDDPYFVAGTALPDWMNVIDRRNRARGQSARPWVDDRDLRLASFARGVLQHHHDDRWFHQTEAFSVLSAQFTRELRPMALDPSGHQAGFVGHIVVELLLDSVLSDDNPEYLIGYYGAIESLDLALLQSIANRICTKPFSGLEQLVPRFCRERFLDDYADNEKLWVRLNHVMHRVRLQALPRQLIDWLPTARDRVRQRAIDLLNEPPQTIPHPPPSTTTEI